MRTPLCQRLGIEVPIIQAPLGGAVGPTLAVAVSNAGGLGMLVPWRADLDTVRWQIRETRALTRRPFGVNLNLDFPQEDRLAVCLEERVPVISFSMGSRRTASLRPASRRGRGDRPIKRRSSGGALPGPHAWRRHGRRDRGTADVGWPERRPGVEAAAGGGDRP
jgi:NAD(P)H-dependent flavin oxidoreductase YrpB (nitropropane dioxygenase family)